MNKHLFQKAKELAQRPYQVHVFLDETTDGEPVYVAAVPEMPGCVSHGDTVEEAKEWLESAKIDFICFLLDHNLEVPEPELLKSTLVFNMPHYNDSEVVNSEDLPVPQYRFFHKERYSIHAPTASERFSAGA